MTSNKLFGVPIKIVDNCPKNILAEAKTVAEIERYKSESTWYGNMTSTFKYDDNVECNVLQFSCPLLLEHIYKSVDEYLYEDLNVDPSKNYNVRIVSSWINYSTKGMFQEYHMHADTDISGVFYINAVKDSGKIFFRNPSPTVLYHRLTFVTNEIDSEVSYSPIGGRMLLWPGYLDHMVSKNKSDGERISVTFNIKL